MKRTYKIDYSESIDNFKKIENIPSDLIYGDPEKIRNPFISYVIPVYKRAHLLEKTIMSILNQKPVDFEWDIVIVDNEAGGENETERLIRRMASDRVLYYRNRENVGPAGNYNKCIELASGEWIAMLHGDDLIMNDHLKCSYEYIRYCQGEKVAPAYISQRYIDFSDEDKEVYLDRDSCTNTNVAINIRHVYANGKPQRQTQKYGILTGYFAALPSFGTLMNREIMLAEGGFTEEFGVCEDVITPFKLADKYGVYMTPVVMGYHRFDGNESMKTETTMEIYESMLDFREYMYSTVWWGKMWKYLSKDIFSENLRNYCIGQSRFGSKRLKDEDFDYIYKVKKLSFFQKAAFNLVNKFIDMKYNFEGFDGMISMMLDGKSESIQKIIDDKRKVVLYGAGDAGKSVCSLLKKKYPKVKIEGFAVTDLSAERELCGYKVRKIDEYAAMRDDVTVITTTVTWQFQDEMNATLERLNFESVINLRGID